MFRAGKSGQLHRVSCLGGVPYKRSVDLAYGGLDRPAIAHEQFARFEIRYIDLRVQCAEVQQWPQHRGPGRPDVLLHRRIRSQTLALEADGGGERQIGKEGGSGDADARRGRGQFPFGLLDVRSLPKQL